MNPVIFVGALLTVQFGAVLLVAEFMHKRGGSYER